MKLISLYLENFKGIREKLYEFDDGITEFVAQNGEGKTTMCDAWYWLWVDKDSELNSNPPIRPNDGRECVVIVTAQLEIDGKPVSFSKKQKCKITEKDGIRKTALKNTFEINSVEKTEKACKEQLAELGIDMDIFLQLSHPDMFLLGINEKKTREQIRNTLFKMADSLTDLEIAKQNQEFEELVPLLTNYSVEEIKAIKASNIRAVKEHYGSKGEIIDAEIRGMQELIVEVDNVSELELQRSALNEQLEELKNSDYDKKFKTTLNELVYKKSELNKKLLDEKSRLEIEKYNKKNTKRAELNVASENYNNCNNEFINSKNKIDSLNKRILDNCNERDELGKRYDKENSLEFDENEKLCKMCGQELPVEKFDQLKTMFEENKKSKLSEIWSYAAKLKQQCKDLENELEQEKAKFIQISSEKEKTKEIYEMLNKDYKDIENITISSELITTLEKEIEDIDIEIRNVKNEALESEYKKEDNEKILEIQDEINLINLKLSSHANNLRIEEKIDDLKEKKLMYSNQLLESEKVLYLLSLLDKTKNDMLSSSINKHFDLVNWKLFAIQKNGEIKSDLCMPVIDGKELTYEANGALKILAKLDIIKSLQKFYGKNYPVFIDGFESVTSNTKERINLDCQIITLSAQEGVKGVSKK